MEFSLANLRAARALRQEQAKKINEVRSLRVNFDFLPNGTEIGGGYARLYINGIPKGFRIRPQNTKPPIIESGFSGEVIATNDFAAQPPQD